MTSSDALWKRWRWALLLLAVARSLADRTLVPPVTSDIVSYLSAARSILEFGRPGRLVAPVGDLSSSIFDPLVAWPIGFPAVYSAALRLISDPAVAAVALDWMFISIGHMAWFV